MKKRKILFLGETYRADAITWMNGLIEFGGFEIITWELKSPNDTLWNRLKRMSELSFSYFKLKQLLKSEKPDMIIAERTTSYGFLAAVVAGKNTPIAIAQQGISDLWPEESAYCPFKKAAQDYAFKRATLIHAWGKAMTLHMEKSNVDMQKVLVMPKGINLNQFEDTNIADSDKIIAIVTRSLLPEYCHALILNAFAILNQKGIDFSLTIVGDGKLLNDLKELASNLEIASKVVFTGRIPNTALPKLLQASNYYVSMPTTEGVSASLFEAMACKCYPIVSDLLGNQSWIKHRENGQLITVGNAQMLADEILWAFEAKEYRENVVAFNRKFVEENANYAINMKTIAKKYHELILKAYG